MVASYFCSACFQICQSAIRSLSMSTEPVLPKPATGTASPQPSIGLPVLASSACRKKPGVVTSTTERPLILAKATPLPWFDRIE